MTASTPDRLHRLSFEDVLAGLVAVDPGSLPDDAETGDGDGS